MIVKTLDEVKGSETHVGDKTWESRRFLLEKDGMGFSMHDTIIYAGTESIFWYKYHQEAVYCIQGEGTLEDLSNGKTYCSSYIDHLEASILLNVNLSFVVINTLIANFLKNNKHFN